MVETLTRQLGETLALLRTVPEDKAGSRYEPGKWSVKEVVGHMCDTERIFAYRALRFARGDRTELPGFKQDGYIEAADFDARTLADLAEEFEHVRRAIHQAVRQPVARGVAAARHGEQQRDQRPRPRAHRRRTRTAPRPHPPREIPLTAPRPAARS